MTVNLTTLLVMTTLFISVSDSLPKTSYIKMIDVWLIANLCVPFAETILHTVIDRIREGVKKEEAEVASPRRRHLGSPRTLKVDPLEEEEKGGKSERGMKKRSSLFDDRRRLLCYSILVTRRGLPCLYGLFIVMYFIVGFVLRAVA